MKSLLYIICITTILISSCTNPDQIEIDLAQLWKFNKGDNIEWSNPEYDDSYWSDIIPNKTWEEQGYEDYDGYAWYRIKFYLPSSIKHRAYIKDTIQIILGKIDDNDQTYLNGKLIGQNAKNISVNKQDSINIPNLYSENRVYLLHVDDSRLEWDKENVLAIRVFDQGGPGGMHGDRKSIKMKDIKDYLKINPGLYSYKFESKDHIFKKISISNISGNYPFEGKFITTIKQIETGEIVYEKEEKISINAGDRLEIPYDFKVIPAERFEATYTFIEKNTFIKISETDEIPYILTPDPPEYPVINSAKVFGVRPGSPVLYTVAASGKRPVRFYAQNLPYGLVLDSITGIISGKLYNRWEYTINLSAKNAEGEANSTLKIKVGDKIALTPPMGWNSWNVWGLSIDSAKVINAAKAMKESGLTNYGWSYINIDDGWEADERLPSNELTGNEKFGNIRAISDSIHAMGLKIGLYSSPGPRTCGGYNGSYKYEFWDVWTWYKWRIDYLKYDWCSYGDIAKNDQLDELQKPYRTMRRALNQLRRDIVYSICQYGMGDVWKWGNDIGGNLWRTTYDITDTWESISSIGFSQSDLYTYAGPGNWNDPDMLVVGNLGWGKDLHATRLTVNEQYTHISLWCLLSAPLLLGCDLTTLEPFTINLLTNNEVIAINQDPLGNQASGIYKSGDIEVWSKYLEDSTKAIGFFNRGKTEIEATINFSDLNMSGKYIIRDLWRQKDIGEFEESFKTTIPKHGVVLTKFKKIN